MKMHFEYLFDRDVTVCEELPLTFHIQKQRDGVMLTVTGDSGNKVAEMPCEVTFRDVNETDLVGPLTLCPKVVIWKVTFPTRLDAGRADCGEITKDVIRLFFKYWQQGAGIGCRIDNEDHSALVEVHFI